MTRIIALAAAFASIITAASASAAHLAHSRRLEHEEKRDVISITIISTNSGGDASTSWTNTTSAGNGSVHDVIVGGDAGLVYTPDTITADVGDFVRFTFMAQNHTATQSSFSDPCTALAPGLDTGFNPNADNTVDPAPQQMFQVLTTDPVWMYCAQTGHCGMGMVFSINPTADKSQAAFKANALATVNSTSSSTSSSTESSSSSASSAVSSSVASAVASAASIVAGSGTTSSDGTCACSCLCGSTDFPSNVADTFGGLSGAISVGEFSTVSRKRGLHGARYIS